MVKLLKRLFGSNGNGKLVAGFKGELTPDQDSYSTDGPVVVTVRLTNSSGESRTFRGAPVKGNVGNGVVKMHQGGFLRLCGPHGTELEPKNLIFIDALSSSVTKTIRDSESIRERIDLSRCFDMKEKGEYTCKIGVLLAKDEIISREVQLIVE